MAERSSSVLVRHWSAALAADVVFVVIFATIGRASHERGLTALGVLETAWPFLAALAVGWLVTFAWRAPLRVVRTGVPLWAITVLGGMVLRAITGMGTAVPFVIVATLMLLLLLVGWRVVARLITRTRKR